MMYCLGLLLVLVTLAVSKEDSCFYFPGNSYLQFSQTNFISSDRAHYRLHFKTTASDGILLYTEGEDDYEALFLMNGTLVYLLVNPSPSGVEGTSGGLYMSSAPVNNNTWLTVDVWRNWEKQVRSAHEAREIKTGLEIENSNRIKESHIDHISHLNVRLYDTVYVGGVSVNSIHMRGASPNDFWGQIRGLYEQRNRRAFDRYDVNHRERVKRCS